METAAAAAAASSSTNINTETELNNDTSEYWSIFTIDNVKSVVKLESNTRLIWRPYSSSFKSTPPPTLDGSHKSDITLPIDSVCIVSITGTSKFSLHCLVINDKVQPLSRTYEKHDFAFISRLGDLPSVPTVSDDVIDDVTDDVSGWINHLKKLVDKTNGYPSERKPVFVYINPYSGTKKAVQIWENDCIPLLKDAGLSFEDHKTEYAGDAMDKVGKLQLENYSAIATVGGDGILSEVINGIMNRSDWETAIKTPLAPIPGGTGNATSYSLYYNTTAVCAICHLVKGQSKKSDLFLAAQPTVGKYIWGFLSCNYGIVAESDFGSEKIRWAGSLRPSIWAVYRIMCGTSYKCKITYLPTEVPRQDWYNVKCSRDCQHCKNALAQLTNDYVTDHSHSSHNSRHHHRRNHHHGNEDSGSESESESESESSESSSYTSSDGENDRGENDHDMENQSSSTNSMDSGGNNGDDEGSSVCTSSSSSSSSAINGMIVEDYDDVTNDVNMTKPTPTSQPIVSSSSSSSSSTSLTTEKKDKTGDDVNAITDDDGSTLPELPESANTVSTDGDFNPTQQINDVTYGPQYTTSMSTCGEWAGDVPSRFATLFGGYEHYQAGGAVPSGWAVQERMELNWVSIQKMPWLMTGMHTAPYAHMVDGCMDITYATAEGFTRISFLKLFMQFSDGSFLNSPKLSYMKVRSFTLEPLDQMGYVGIDGERIPFAPISVHVAQAITNFVCFV